jgi:hypothetical protein
LFRSDGQGELLAELFLSGADELNLNELAQRAGLAYGSVHREVRRLLDAGLLIERRVGQARLVRPDPESPLTQPVRDLLGSLPGWSRCWPPSSATSRECGPPSSTARSPPWQ